MPLSCRVTIPTLRTSFAVLAGLWVPAVRRRVFVENPRRALAELETRQSAGALSPNLGPPATQDRRNRKIDLVLHPGRVPAADPVD